MKSLSTIVLAATMTGSMLAMPMAQAAGQQATRQQVRELMQLSGVSKVMQTMSTQMNRQMSTVMQQSFPCVKAGYWNGFINAKSMKTLLDRIVPVYQKHFTRAEIDGLLKFYRSPLGRKVTSTMPQIMRESMQIGQQWGRQRAEQMFATLKKNGTLDAEGKCPVPKKTGK